MLKYRSLAAEITTIGGLLQSHSAGEILSDPVIVDLIAVMGHQRPTDPYLLTAVCTFAYDLMENPDVCNSEEVMRPFYENMADLKYLVPYIGFYQYEPLLEMTQKYHDAFVDELKIQEELDDAEKTKKETTVMD